MRVAPLICAVAVLAMAPGFVHAEDTEAGRLRKEIEKQRKDMQTEIDELRARLTKTEDRAIDRARDFEKEKRELYDKLDAAYKEQTRVERELAIAKARIAQLEGKPTEATPKDSAPKPAEQPDDGEEKPWTDAEVKRALEEQKINLNFDDTPFADVVGFLGDISGVSFVSLAPEGAGKVTLKVKEVSVSAALDLIVGAAKDLAWKIEGGLVTFAPVKNAPAHVKLDLPARLEKTLARPVQLGFEDKPLADAVKVLAECGLEGLSVADGAKNVKVTVSLRRVQLRSALEVICRKHGLRVRAEGERLILGLK